MAELTVSKFQEAQLELETEAMWLVQRGDEIIGFVTQDEPGVWYDAHSGFADTSKWLDTFPDDEYGFKAALAAIAGGEPVREAE